MLEYSYSNIFVFEPLCKSSLHSVLVLFFYYARRSSEDPKSTLPLRSIRRLASLEESPK